MALVVSALAVRPRKEFSITNLAHRGVRSVRADAPPRADASFLITSAMFGGTMVPVMPHVDVPGDNPRDFTPDHGSPVRARIMARSGQLRGVDLDQLLAVWCFGFTRGSEAAHAYGVYLPDDTLFYWVLSTVDGRVVQTLTNLPAIELPAPWREVINWEMDESPWADHGEIFVALVLDADGNLHDRTYNWETAQNYALSEGLRVIAIRGDGSMTVEQCQALYDAERERYIDCFGGTPERQSDDTSSMGERCGWNDA